MAVGKRDTVTRKELVVGLKHGCLFSAERCTNALDLRGNAIRHNKIFPYNKKF